MKLVQFLVISLCALMMMQSANARDRSRFTLEPEEYQNKPIAVGNIVWYCAYSGKMLTIDCEIGRFPEQGVKPHQSTIDHKLPQTALRILRDPQSFAGRVVSIPLYAPPFEFSYAGLLAEGVMCGARPDCSIIFARNTRQLAALVNEFEGQGLLSDNGGVALAGKDS